MFWNLRVIGSLVLFHIGLALTVAIVFYGYSIPVHPDFFLLAAIVFIEWILPLGIGVFFSMGAAIFFFKLTRRKPKKKVLPEIKGIDDLELEDYRRFFNSLYNYKGSYPAWKALQEYRELILALNPSEHHCAYHFHNVDSYLERVVDGLNLLRKYHGEHRHGHGWSEDHLPGAKGDHLLERIKAKHPAFIDYDNSKDNQ